MTKTRLETDQMAMRPGRAPRPYGSASSLVFDVVFGVIPACICALFALYGSSLIISSGLFSNQFLGLLLLSLIGFTSSLALLYAISTRGRVKYKAIVVGLLLAGVVVAAIVTLFLISPGFEGLVWTLPPLMVTACAVKYLRALSTSEVHP